MKKSKKWLLAGFSDEEISVLRKVADEIEFPAPVVISPSQADLTLEEILDGQEGHSDWQQFDTRLVLFANFQRSEISGFVAVYKTLGLPRPFFAAVTPHSIRWPLKKLLTDLAEERAEIEAQKAKK